MILRFALMAVVPDTRYSHSRKLYMLKLNREIVIKGIAKVSAVKAVVLHDVLLLIIFILIKTKKQKF
jgi:hypothetical protein